MDPVDIPDHPDKDDPQHPVNQIAEMVGGAVSEMKILPDGSGFAMMSMPLPKDHWALADDGEYDPPPMLLKIGSAEGFQYQIGRQAACSLNKREFAELIRGAGKYAYRAATMKGKEPDLDPDALLQNLVVAFLGYWTDDGLSGDEWANPPSRRKADR